MTRCPDFECKMVHHGLDERPYEEEPCGCIGYRVFRAYDECSVCGSVRSGTVYASWTDTTMCQEGHDRNY